MPPSSPNPPSTDSAPRALRLQPEIGQLAGLAAYIEDFAERHCLVLTDAMAFTLAAEELFANTLSHGQPHATLVEFSLACDVGADGACINATYCDDGAAFDPTTIPEADTSLPVEQRRIGGLGIHFIRRSMQTFAYRREGERNVITFSRALTVPSVGSSG